MKRLVTGVLLAAGLTGAVYGQKTTATAPKSLPGGYKLVWADDFNGSKLNPKKWDPELGVIRNQGTQQTYTGRPENVRLEDGCLVLETHFETFENVNYGKAGAPWIKNTKTMPYTSGSVTSKDTKQFLFGRLEVRAKVPRTKGIWPAIWLLGKNKWGWPTNGEIDMLENISQEPDAVYSTFHRSVDGTSRKNAPTGGKVRIPNLNQDFHTYVMEWDKDNIKLMVDNKVVKSIKVADMDHKDGSGNPFRTPFYVILNSAVGGSWCEKAPADGKGYPVQYLIDYVRFYQTPEHVKQGKLFDPKTGLPKKK